MNDVYSRHMANIAEVPLPNITDTLLLLQPQGETRWNQLGQNIPHESVSIFQLEAKILAQTRQLIERNIPYFRTKISRNVEYQRVLQTASDQDLALVLCENQSGLIITEEVNDQRVDTFLTAAAMVTKRVETTTWSNALSSSSPEQLSALGLAPETRDLLVDLIWATEPMNPLYVRFQAFAELSVATPTEASATTFFPEDSANTQGKSLSQMFPKETSSLSNRLGQIIEKQSDWTNLPGAQTFKNYLQKLSEYFGEVDPTNGETLLAEAITLYEETLLSDFPIFVVPPMEAFRMLPHFDPELRVCLKLKESNQQLGRTKTSFADALKTINLSSFREIVDAKHAIAAFAITSNGAGIVFTASAQELPLTVIFDNIQLRHNDKLFPEFVKLFRHAQEKFGIDSDLAATLQTKMSYLTTLLHEFCHYIFIELEDQELQQRLGREGTRIMTDIKVESLYRALIPEMIKNGGVDGTLDQWAIALTAQAIQMIINNKARDPYRLAAEYVLNQQFSLGVLKIENGKIIITDYDRFWSIANMDSQRVIDLYQDQTTTPDDVQNWLEQNTRLDLDIVKSIESLK